MRLYPTKIVVFGHDVDSIYFHTDNSVIEGNVRDSLIRFRFTTGYFLLI
jgi:alpha-glucosidase